MDSNSICICTARLQKCDPICKKRLLTEMAVEPFFNALSVDFQCIDNDFQRVLNAFSTVCQRFSKHWKMFFNAFIMFCNTLATFCSRDIKPFNMITPVIEDFPSNSRTRLHAPLEYFINLIIVFTQNLEEIRPSNTLFPQGGITSEIWLTANTELKCNKHNRNNPCIIVLAALLLFPVE